MDFWTWLLHPDRWNAFPAAVAGAVLAALTSLLVVSLTRRNSERLARQDRWETALTEAVEVVRRSLLVHPSSLKESDFVTLETSLTRMRVVGRNKALGDALVGWSHDMRDVVAVYHLVGDSQVPGAWNKSVHDLPDVITEAGESGVKMFAELLLDGSSFDHRSAGRLARKVSKLRKETTSPAAAEARRLYQGILEA